MFVDCCVRLSSPKIVNLLFLSSRRYEYSYGLADSSDAQLRDIIGDCLDCLSISIISIVVSWARLFSDPKAMHDGEMFYHRNNSARSLDSIIQCVKPNGIN